MCSNNIYYIYICFILWYHWNDRENFGIVPKEKEVFHYLRVSWFLCNNVVIYHNKKIR